MVEVVVEVEEDMLATRPMMLVQPMAAMGVVDVMVEGMEAPNKNVFNPQTQSLFKVFL